VPRTRSSTINFLLSELAANRIGEIASGAVRSAGPRVRAGGRRWRRYLHGGRRDDLWVLTGAERLFAWLVKGFFLPLNFTALVGLLGQ
jgi:hypothetical protein